MIEIFYRQVIWLKKTFARGWLCSLKKYKQLFSQYNVPTTLSINLKFRAEKSVRHLTFWNGNMEGDSERKDDDKIGEKELGDGPEHFASDEHMAPDSKFDIIW